MKGDGVNYPDGPMDMFSVTEEQYLNLKRWAEGDFINDYQTIQETIKTFNDIPIAQQPQALNQAALEACSGGAFHPGVELTYNLRHPRSINGTTTNRRTLPVLSKSWIPKPRPRTGINKHNPASRVQRRTITDRAADARRPHTLDGNSLAM